MKPTRTQALIALLIFTAFIAFIFIGLRANRQTVNLTPRAQVAPASIACSSDADCVAYANQMGFCRAGLACAARCDSGSCVFAATGAGGAITTAPVPTTTSLPGGGTTSTGGGGSSSGSTGSTGTGGAPVVVPTTNSGTTLPPVCQEGAREIRIEQCPASTPSSSVANSVVTYKITGVECFDGSFVAVNKSCMDRAQVAAEMAAMKPEADALCAGKKAPGCGDSVVTVAPPSDITGLPNSCPTKSRGDINCDGKIDLIDFNLWLAEFNSSAPTKNADINGDGKVSLVDFEIWRGTFVGS